MHFVSSESDLIAACSGYNLVGFHGTSSAACGAIEASGFLPDKVFGIADHCQIIDIATSLGADTAGYRQWLDMKSVTFAKQAADAIAHVRAGHAGGQGLFNVVPVLRRILDDGNEQQKAIAKPMFDRIVSIRRAPLVVYAVDLTGLEGRLARDQKKPLFHYFLDPNQPAPRISDIAPTRLIARLSLV